MRAAELRAGARAGVGVRGWQSPHYLPPRGVCAGVGGEAPSALGYGAAAGRERSVGSGELGDRSYRRSGRVPKTPSTVVDRILVKWSLASSARSQVEVSMMRKLCDTGLRKRLAGVGWGQFKGTVGLLAPLSVLARNWKAWKEELS